MKVEWDVPLARNIKRVGHIDIPGGGQVVVEGDFAYVGHMDPPHGTSVLDVSDPKKPKVVSQIGLTGDASHTHKVRVVGDLMYTNVEQNRRHFLRKGERLPELRAHLAEKLGRPATDDQLAKDLGVKASDIADLDAAREHPYRDGGFKVYDIADRKQPKEIAYRRTAGFGVHRFDVDEKYAYISTEMEGYVGNILVIYDMADPTNPAEVSRWHMPGQHVAGDETPTWKGYGNRLHHAMRVGDELWAAVWQAGIRVIDVSDIRSPETVGIYNYHPQIPEPTHTIMPLEQPINGRRYAVAVDEAHASHHGRLPGFMWIFDVTDLKDMKPVSAFCLGEMDSPFSRAPGGRHGVHQYREKLDSTLVYSAWFSGGLRIIDVANPLLPVEIAHYIPEPVGDETSPNSNDVDLDHRSLIYLLDRNRGLDILEYTG